MCKHPKYEIFNYLGCSEIIQNYTKWIWQGEVTKKRPLSPTIKDDGGFMNDTLEDMICDIGVDTFKNANVVDTLQKYMEESLYLG